MKPSRYSLLDGMRGVAALFIVIRHTSDYWHFSLFRSYLAVDFFFLLSGFVIAHAYDEKLRTGALSVGEFLKIRLIRLYPVFFLSVMLSAVELLGKTLANHQFGSGHLAQLAGVIGLTLLFLPSKLAGSPNTFPMNSPYWSLFFEIVVNGLYAMLRPALTVRVLAASVVLSGLGVAVLCVRRGSLDLGFVWGAEQVFGGFVRALFGIFFGLLLQQKPLSIPRKLPRWLAVVLLAAVLASPSAGRWDTAIDLLVVALVFPMALLVAAQPAQSRAEKLWLVLGAASYPLYVLHLPISLLLMHGLRGVIQRTAPLSGIALVGMLVALSLAVERYYDIPMRRWLLRISQK